MSKRLFIVEDHQMVRESYTFFFDAAAGMEVCGAVATAEEALEQIPRTEPDLVIIDMLLPGMNGLELLKKCRQDHPDMRLLMISGHEEARYAEPARRAGADGFVHKSHANRILEAAESVLMGEPFFPDVKEDSNTDSRPVRARSRRRR